MGPHLVAGGRRRARGAGSHRPDLVIHHGLRPPAPTRPGDGVVTAGFERYALVLGTTERRKRVPDVVAAMAAVPADVGLVIAGPTGNDEPAVERAIATAGAQHRIRRLTDVDDTTRDALVNDATVLVLAAGYEGFGFTPLEAAAAGTAVVATAVGALPELIGDLVDLADPADPDLGPLLAAACEDPTMPVALIERLRDLTWAAHAEAMVDLYRLASSS
ncbi:MAG: glycosyltransferase [Actinomycetota bacterium]